MVAMIMGWGISPEQGWRKGPWTPAEDQLLSEYVKLHGEGRWSSVSRCAGLNRSGKSCRLRWVNYLRPGLKRDQITPQEEGIIIELHALWGNKWSTIARYLPGRTDNLIKNYWRTHFKKREKSSQKQDKERERQQQRVLEAGEMKRVNTNVIEAQAGKQEMMPAPPAAAFMYPSLEDQCLPVNVMSQDVAASWAADYSVVEDQDYGLWGGLWNLDDYPHPQNHNSTNCNMIAMQNQAPTFSFVGDSI